MAESLRLAAIQFLFCAWCVSGVAGRALAAENLPDPTRPPVPQALVGDGMTTTSSPLILQSVLISPGRNVAVVNGQTVQIGDRLGDARVAKIAEGEVVLTRGEKSQTLRLFPGIEKRQARNGVSVRESGRRH